MHVLDAFPITTNLPILQIVDALHCLTGDGVELLGSVLNFFFRIAFSSKICFPSDFTSNSILEPLIDISHSRIYNSNIFPENCVHFES